MCGVSLPPLSPTSVSSSEKWSLGSFLSEPFQRLHRFTVPTPGPCSAERVSGAAAGVSWTLTKDPRQVEGCWGGHRAASLGRRRRGGAAERKTRGRRERGSGPGQRRGEEVNRFCAWEPWPRREFQSCRRRCLHRGQAHSQPVGPHPPFWSLFLLGVPPPRKGLRARGHTHSPYPRTTPSPSSRKRPPGPGRWRPLPPHQVGTPSSMFQKKQQG